jgi:hypothetical protein
MEREAAERVAESWGKAVNRLHQWIARRQKQAGLPRLSVSVSEVQPSRSEDDPLGSLHLHVVFLGKRNRYQKWAFDCGEIRSFWLSQLSRLAGETVESEAVENLKVVRKTAEGYLGKYMSKGAKELQKIVAVAGYSCIPRQWWGATKAAKLLLKRETLSSSKAANMLQSLVDEYFRSEGVPFPGVMFAHHIEIDGHAILAGYSGRFDRETNCILRELLKCD